MTKSTQLIVYSMDKVDSFHPVRGIFWQGSAGVYNPNGTTA